MSQKRREQRRQQQAQAAGEIRWAAVLRSVVLAGAMALVTMSVLIPSEASIGEGSYAPLAAGWSLLLVVFGLSLVLDERPRLELGWTDAAGAALVGWHSVAAIHVLGQGNGRQALNAHWIIVGYGIMVFLLRQVLRTEQQARAVVGGMVALAALLAGLGLYQYGYSMPALRRQYASDPAALLAASGIASEAGSPERELLEYRLQSVEPLATFALTNSLAGFLAPWLIAAVAIGFVAWQERGAWRGQGGWQARGVWRLLTAVTVAGALIAACLVLTKSRTAYLATAAGLLLVGLYGRRSSWRLDWRIPATVAGGGVILGLAAVYFGGLDVQVVSEAPKSILYRLEYWQATARMIVEQPVFGCGPGNFQEAYVGYKLPQASETVADPHNFLLEMWATAGTPAVVLLVALIGAFALEIAARAGLTPAEGESPVDDGRVAPARWVVFGGMAAGLLVAPLVSAALGHPLEPMTPLMVLWPLGLAIGGTAWWSLEGWIAGGKLSLTGAIVPQIVLLINLLAAGALVFPGVMATVLVLAPVALLVAGHVAGAAAGAEGAKPGSSRRPWIEWKVPRAMAAGIALAATGLAATCLYTEHYPVFDGRRALAEAMFQLGQKHPREAEAAAAAAAKADPLSPEPWRVLGELRLVRWQASGSSNDWEAFLGAADALRRLDGRHHQAWQTRGMWFLSAWRKSRRPEDLHEAVDAFTRASTCYPNGALFHAQLAWALHLAGRNEDAAQEAERALALDRQMPHKERKLARLHVADPQAIDPQRSGQEVKMFREESAEQTAERLRTATAEDLR